MKNNTIGKRKRTKGQTKVDKELYRRLRYIWVLGVHVMSVSALMHSGAGTAYPSGAPGLTPGY